MNIPQTQLPYFDVAVAAVVVSSVMNVIPAIAALLAVVWYCLLIWESQTVRGWTGRTEKTTTYIVKETTHPDQGP